MTVERKDGLTCEGCRFWDDEVAGDWEIRFYDIGVCICDQSEHNAHFLVDTHSRCVQWEERPSVEEVYRRYREKGGLGDV